MKVTYNNKNIYKHDTIITIVKVDPEDLTHFNSQQHNEKELHKRLKEQCAGFNIILGQCIVFFSSFFDFAHPLPP